MSDIKQKRIDDKAEYLDPIDYSFKDLMNLGEIKDMQPRYPEKSKGPKQIDGKYASLSLKIGYNALTDLNGLFEWCSQMFVNPKQITSLDLSFNVLSDIPNEILQFEGLKILYLHGNKIKGAEEVDKLAKLNNLTTLTLHGNPIENLPGIRNYVIAKLPNLRNFNFSTISKGDRTTAHTWNKTYHGKIKVAPEPVKKQKAKVEEEN